jgi:hypothetical protein
MLKRPHHETSQERKQVRFSGSVNDPADDEEDEEDLLPGEEWDPKSTESENLSVRPGKSKGKGGKSHEDDDGDEEDNDDAADEVNPNDWSQLSEKVYSTRELNQLEEEEMEPFDLSEERKLGSFDATGSFTWTRRDLDEDGDTEWLAQVGDEVAQIRDKRKPTTVEYDDAAAVREEHPLIAMAKIVPLLQPQETALDALKRLKNEKDKFNLLTECCDRLLRGGMVEIYTKTREALFAKLKPINWEYRADGQDEIHGPYSGLDMETWRVEHGFFTKDAVEKCWVRQALNGADSRWIEAEHVQTFLLQEQ